MEGIALKVLLVEAVATLAIADLAMTASASKCYSWNEKSNFSSNSSN